MTLLAGFASASDLCPVPSAANNRNVSAECSPGWFGWRNLYVGYAENAGSQCVFDGCGPDVIDCGCGITSHFMWYVSRSDVDHADTTGPLSSDVLYLWLHDCSQYGFAAAEFALGGSLSVLEFVPLNGFLNFGTATELLLTHEDTCVAGTEILVGEIRVQSPVSLDALSWGRTKMRYRD